MRDDLEIPYPNLSGGAGTAYTPRDYRGMGGMDANTKRMAIIAGAIGGSLLLLMGVWSLTGHRRTGIPVIEADMRPVRERPVNKGGLAINGADETILSGEAEGKPVMAPAPEAPAIQALKAKPAPQAAEPAPATVAPRANPVAEASKPAAPAPGAAASAPAAPAPAQVAPVTPTPVAPTPAAAAIAAAKPVPAAKPAAPVAPAAVAGTGKIQVQLAALPTEEAANAEWQRLSRRFPDVLGGRSAVFSHTERDGKQFWRIRVTGFTEIGGATAFCDKLRGKGATCVTANF
eukprot:gene1851-1881_t